MNTAHAITIAEHGARRNVLFADCHNCAWKAGPHTYAVLARKVEAHKADTAGRPLLRIRAALAYAGILSDGEISSLIRAHRDGVLCWTEAVMHGYRGNTHEAIRHAYRCRAMCQRRRLMAASLLHAETGVIVEVPTDALMRERGDA